MERVLGIDYGEARIGLAVSDELGMLAHPVETIHRNAVPDFLARIVEVAAEKAVSLVVVGLPLHLDGSRGAAVEKVESFVSGLREKLPEGIPVKTVDERLSTVEAQRKLHEAGRTVKNSRNVIDQMAAVVILQDYLDETALKNGALSDLPGALEIDDED
ncbi:MAG: Holliday junction resolvase RuvX [Verrucomicrobiota bacterium]